MASKLGKSTVLANGDANDMFDFKAYNESFDLGLFDGFGSQRIDSGHALPKPDLPTVGLYVAGTERDDTLYGSELADEIHGNGGADRIDAGGGNDLLFGGLGDDALFGGAGVDTVSYADSDALMPTRFSPTASKVTRTVNIHTLSKPTRFTALSASSAQTTTTI